MPTTEDYHAEALRAYQSGDAAAAERACAELFRLEPLHAEGLYLTGVLALDAGLTARAVQQFHHAATLQPASATFHNALGEAWRSWGDRARALASFREAVRLDPGLAVAHNALGQALLDGGHLDEAAAAFQQALASSPDYARAHNNLGRVHHARGHHGPAADCFREAVRLAPGYELAHNNLGAALLALGRYDEAAPCFLHALRVRPGYPEAHFGLGVVLQSRGDAAGAAARFREAVRLRPGYLKALNSLGAVCTGLGHFDEALACLREARRLQPENVEALSHLAQLLLRQSRWDEALEVFEQILALQPDHAEAFAQRVRLRELSCDWRERDTDFQRLGAEATARLEAGQLPGVTPFNSWSAPWPPERLLAVARAHADHHDRTMAPLRRLLAFTRPAARLGRLRIGYFSYDFRDHATGHQMQGLFGLHDRSAFEAFAYSFGPDDGSSHRRRIAAECEHFVDVAGASTEAIARRIHADGVHILVDLNCLSGNNRVDVLALRPAPIQVSYFYAATTGAGFYDYLFTDRVTTPAEDVRHFAEKLVFMPHTYYVTDHTQPVADITPRGDLGLPATGLVFCCFNASYKFEPATFSVWMNILRQVPGSVLWLLSPGPTGEGNLRREAVARGVPADRLVFAGRAAKPDHLARQRRADLFLDTRDINAHTTACDALWVGLPVLTCPGRNYAGRVAASLLTAVGLPDLIAPDLAAYQARAVHLATHPAELAEVRARLAANRTTWPLFDTPRWVRNLECAYREMWRLHEAGEPPRHLHLTEGGPGP